MSVAQLTHDLKSAFKQNLVPAIILQSFALSIAICYFFWPASHNVFSFFAELKAQYGWRYAGVSTAIFAGIIPFLYLLATNKVASGKITLLIFYVLFWAYKGIEINFVFQLQSWLFGSTFNFETVVKKTLADQLIYAPLWVVPSIVLTYLWRDLNFSFRRWRHAIKQPELWQLKIPTVIISNWLIWVPAVAIIYSMPPMLQIPMFNLVMCFFVILLASLQHKAQADET